MWLSISVHILEAFPILTKGSVMNSQKRMRIFLVFCSLKKNCVQMHPIETIRVVWDKDDNKIGSHPLKYS